MAFENVQANPYDMMVQTGLQDPPSNQTVFLKAFDKDHLSGERFFSGGERVPFEPMMDRITSSNVTADFRHAQQDFDGNGYYAPSNKLDALAIGGSPHGAHPAVDDFMRPLFEQIMERATQVQEQYKALKIAELDARTSPPATQADYDRIETDAKIIADNFAAREHAAVTNFRALALQEGGIPEAKALMGLSDDQTLLAYNDTDLRNPHDPGTAEYRDWDAQKSSPARQTFTMDKITGVIDLDHMLAINVDRDLINPDPDAQILRNLPPRPATGQCKPHRFTPKLRRRSVPVSHRTTPGSSVGALHIFQASPTCPNRPVEQGGRWATHS